MRACGERNEEVINVLSNAGADCNLTNVNGETCIHYAVIGGCSKETLLAIINHGADVNATNKDNVTALITACKKKHIDAINVLLNAGADPNIFGVDDAPCIHYMVLGACNTEALLAVISHGADANATNNFGVTALMEASWKGNVEAINVLLDAGANPSTADKGLTWLHHAVLGRCIRETMQAIVDLGADVNATNNDGITALMTACRKGTADAINVLLSAGADLNITDCLGSTCIHYSADSDRNNGTLQVIIDHGADVNATNNYSVTALMIACWKGNVGAINVLLAAGADLNITDSDDGICIHHATDEDSNNQTLHSIIDHRADANATDNDTNSVTTLFGCRTSCTIA